MSVDAILAMMNRFQVQFLLIGGMNFALQHLPVLTFDVDLWIEDTPANRQRCHLALSELQAEWGKDDQDWKRVAERTQADWLVGQAVFCLASPDGAVDIFREVPGLTDWQSAFDRSAEHTTDAGVPYRGISDADMLACQLALPQAQRKHERIRYLRALLGEKLE